MVAEELKHKNVYEDESRIAVKLPLNHSLQEMHEEGYFPLVEDPKQTGKTVFIGMFVLRPGRDAWKGPIVQSGNANSLYDVEGWTYNIKGLDGGWMISNGNTMDGYRLALQYGLADAVIVGSTTAAVEGTPHNGQKGYVWHPYNPVSWPQVKNADPNLLQKILEQRREFQKAGYLSDRKYPAQIVVTQSGKEGSPDILEATIFHGNDPEGEPIEAYILTSKTGAEKIRERAPAELNGRSIDDIIIEVSATNNPNVIDLQRLPEVLYSKPYNMKMVNHDGGATVLSQFAKAGILPQMNLTLTRQQSLEHVLQNVEDSRVTEEVKQNVLQNFDEKTDKFFGTEDGSIPRELIPVHIISDNIDEAAVVTFDSRGLAGKGFR